MKKSNWIPKIKDKPNELKTDSWFNILKYKNPDFDSKKYVTETKKNLVRTKKIKIYPNETQREYIQKWIELSRKIYNKTVKFLNKHIFDKEGFPIKEKVKEYVNAIKLRDVYLKEEKKKLLQDNIASYMLDEMIKRCVAMFKSSLTKQKNDKKKRKFEMRVIKKGISH